MKKQFNHFKLAGVLVLLWALLPATGFSQVIYVSQNAAGLNNGSSWPDAFTDLQDALSAASSGDEIWVAQGVYKPSVVIDLNGSGGFDPREAVFFLPDGVALYGGFAGNEASLAERNHLVHQTVLSGDIDNNDLNPDGNFIAESPGDVVGENAYHVIFTENAGPSTRLDGFDVTAGRADIAVFTGPNDPNLDGGGWYSRLSAPSWSASPVIANTTFTGNYAASEGGAVYFAPGPAGAETSPVIENCLFLNNESGNTAGALFIGSFSPGTYNPSIINCRFTGNEAYRRGGAVYLLGDHATITSSLFENNSVTVVSEDMSTLPGSGGAVSLVASNAVFTKCMFLHNSSTGNPTGAFEGGGGGAVYISVNEPQTSSLGESSPGFIACGFFNNSAQGNTAAWGGAVVYLNDGGILEPAFVNCVFSENEAMNHGGAVAGFTRVINDPVGFSPRLNPEFTNTTFYGNEAGQLGGAIYHSGYDYSGTQVLEAVIINTIIWGNTAGSNGDQIYSTGNAMISHSLIEGSGGSGGSWDSALGTDGGNNLDVLPGFVNEGNPLGADNLPATPDDGLRLTQFSAAVNAGDNTAAGLSGITEDFTGAPRIRNGVVDMGAYERGGIILPDFDFVWLFNWRDIQIPCLSCPPPWSFLLFRDFGFEPHYIWKEPAKFAAKGNGATITGEIVNLHDAGISFKVYLELFKEHTWDTWSRQQGTWFSIADEAEAVAGTEHVNWKFWRLSTASYLEGTGKVKGLLQLKQFSSSDKTGFQMGQGANAVDSDFGIAGYFSYNGKLTFNGKKLQVKGKGSFNADAVPCETDCEQLFVQEPEDKGRGNKKSASLTDADPDNFSVKIYPVPAGDYLVLESANPVEDNLKVKIHDTSGRVLISDKWSLGTGIHQIDLGRLNKGFYILNVSSDSGEFQFNERFVKK